MNIQVEGGRGLPQGNATGQPQNQRQKMGMGTKPAGTAENSQMPMGKVGRIPYLHVLGTVPACGFAGAKLLGQNPFVHCCESRLGSALYVLRDGSFCSITGRFAQMIPGNEMSSYLAQEGCPWEFTETQLSRLPRPVRDMCASRYPMKNGRSGAGKTANPAQPK